MQHAEGCYNADMFCRISCDATQHAREEARERGIQDEKVARMLESAEDEGTCDELSAGGDYEEDNLVYFSLFSP